MAVEIRLAKNEEEKRAVYRLRYELFVEDQSLFGEEADHQNRLLFDTFDACSTIAMAIDNGRLIGTMRMTLGNHYTWDASSVEVYQMRLFDGAVARRDITTVTRFVIEKAYRGTDVSARLMEICFRHAARNNAELILANCEPHLVSHYIPFGFRPFGQLNNHETNGMRVAICIVCGDLDHLRRINSPMHSAFAERTAVNHKPALLSEIVSNDPAVMNQCSLDPEIYAAKAARYLSRAAAGNAILKRILAKDASSLINRSQILKCAPNSGLIRKGHASHTVYILLEGSLTVNNGPRELAQVSRPGTLIGEVAFFTGQKRTEDVFIGQNGARLMVLSVSRLKKLLETRNTNTMAFLQYVSRELAHKLGHPARSLRRLQRTEQAITALSRQIARQCAQLATRNTAGINQTIAA